MKRIHAFEFLDLPWYPNIFRRMQTDYLQFATTLGSGHKTIIPLIHNAMKQAGTNQIIDLCSGSSGPWRGLLPLFQAENIPLQITLTDKFPQEEVVQAWNTNEIQFIRYYPDSVDATDVPKQLTGMRILFEGFHHFKPVDAQKILKNAKENNSAIGIFEASIKPPLGWLMLVLSPVITFLTYMLITPFLKPRAFSRFLWTYLLPIVPLATCWDGFISLLRVYSPKALMELVEILHSENYVWEAGTASTGTPIFEFTYLIGYPVKETNK
jgi:hypothetical protein